MASYAEEGAALRGTRSATLKDLLKHPAFSKLFVETEIDDVTRRRRVGGRPVRARAREAAPL